MAIELANINLNRLVVFATVVETGSFTRAADRLGLAKTMVSTHIQRLEAELAVSLLVRTTRRLALTEAGESFYEAVRSILRTTEEAIHAIGHAQPELRGTLRLTAPVDYSASVIMPMAAQLTAQHPQLKIDVLSSDRAVDLVAEGIDVAIRLGKLADSAYQAVRVAALESWLVAAPAVAAALGKLNDPADLAHAPFVALSVLPHPLSWAFAGPDGQRRAVEFQSRLSANTAHAVRAATLGGGGIAMLPDFAVADDVRDARLIRLMPGWTTGNGGVYAVFPATRYRPPKVRMLIEALKQHLAGSEIKG